MTGDSDNPESDGFCSNKFAKLRSIQSNSVRSCQSFLLSFFFFFGMGGEMALIRITEIVSNVSVFLSSVVFDAARGGKVSFYGGCEIRH